MAPRLSRLAEDALGDLAMRLRATVERERRLRREGALRKSIDLPLRAAGGWCAPSGPNVPPAPPVTAARHERAPSWWTHVETPAQRRDRERRFRWEVEDRWLREQEQLARSTDM